MLIYDCSMAETNLGLKKLVELITDAPLLNKLNEVRSF